MPAMKSTLQDIRPGLALVLLGLLFGTVLGIWFGIDEALYFQGCIAHGIAAFSLGLLWLVAATDLSARMRGLTSVLVGLASAYPLA